MRRRAVAARVEEAGRPNYIAAIIRNLWPNLPALVVSSCAVCVVAFLVTLIFPGVTPLAMICWGLLVGPAFGGLVGQIVSLASGGEIPTWSYWRYLRVTWRLAMSAWALPALAGCSFVVAMQFWSDTGNGLALLSMAAGGTVGVLSSIAALVSVVLGLRISTLRGWGLGLMSLQTVAKRPVPLLGALSVLFLLVWASVRLSASLILLVPGSFAVVIVAAALTSAEASGLWRASSDARNQ